MTRDMLRVDGVSPETKEQLQEAALQLYGKANASLMVRSLIAEHLAKTKAKGQAAPALNLNEKKVRVELRLPHSVEAEISKRAESRLSDRNYYIISLILEHLGQGQLKGDEIEILRRSNYELAKVGSNLNQIAKAFNILVKMGGSGKTPEIGKKMASLRRDITEHTRKVLRVLEAKTTVWEAKGRGQKPRKSK
jgi:hypothetical protein